MQAPTHRNARLRQGLRRFLAIRSQQERQCPRLVFSGENRNSQAAQLPGTETCLFLLPPQDPFHPYFVYITHSFRQARNPGHIYRSRLRPIRQKVRHLLLQGVTARATADQAFGQLAAEQKSRPLGPNNPLWPGIAIKAAPN